MFTGGKLSGGALFSNSQGSTFLHCAAVFMFAGEKDLQPELHADVR